MSENYILGNDVVISTDSSVTQINNNICVVGPSGAGKTMSYAEMCLLKTEQTSLIVTLSKRRLVTTYMRYLKEKGYKVYDLNLCDPSQSTVAYDPMAYVHNQADVIYLARSIVMADSRKMEAIGTDPFWDASAISLLSAIIAYEVYVKSRPTFADVYSLFSQLSITNKGDSIETSLDELFDRASRDPEMAFAYQCWKTFRFAPMRTAGSIYSSLSVTMDTIFTPQLRQAMTGKPLVDVTAISKERSVLFVTTSAVNPALDVFAGLFYSNAVKVLFEHAESRENGRLDIPVHLLCDDFAVGAQIPEFAHYISIFREKGIQVSILLQSESQLRSMYGTADATTIINNCDRYVYMGGMDLATCRNMSERLGIPLSELLAMPIGSEYVFQRGSRPVRTTRFSIKEDPDWIKVNGEQ